MWRELALKTPECCDRQQGRSAPDIRQHGRTRQTQRHHRHGRETGRRAEMPYGRPDARCREWQTKVTPVNRFHALGSTTVKFKRRTASGDSRNTVFRADEAISALTQWKSTSSVGPRGWANEDRPGRRNSMSIMLWFLRLKTAHSRLVESEMVMRICSVPRAVGTSTPNSGNLVRR
jgi:hypothetical protein